MCKRNGRMKWTALLVTLSILFLFPCDRSLKAANESGNGREEAKVTATEGTGSIERDTVKPSRVKKGFPWVLAVAGVVVVAAVVYFTVVKKPKYTLTVTVGEGVAGSPLSGKSTFKKGESISYSYALASGFNSLQVTLDGEPVSPSGSFAMDRDHALEARAAGNVEVKRVVVAEQFTATWCGYCPGAAMGLDQLKNENPTTMVVIAYHWDDSFSNTGVYNIRKAYYGVNGIPDVWFDGKERVTGGNATQTMYSTYKPLYDRRSAVPPVVNCRMTSIGRDTFQVEIINVSNAAVSGTFHFALVEDKIPFQWKNQSVSRFVLRDMVPSANGEAIALAQGQTKTFTRTFNVAAGWNRANCHVVAFVQGGNKEIYQGCEALVPAN